MSELPKWSRHDGPHEELGNAWPPPEHLLPRYRIKPGRVVVDGEEIEVTDTTVNLAAGTNIIETTHGPVTVTIVDGTTDPVD